LTPPTLVVCLDRSNSTFARLREVGAFAVNLLGDAHETLAGRFAGRGGIKGAERFEVGDWISLVTGAPVLADALAAVDCHVEEIIERHTHAIVIGAVQAVRIGGEQPALLHWRSRFEQLR
jgi:flavin reductase (DIM6/NTAB) family NADH-FMN oxidoreductase RutF